MHVIAAVQALGLPAAQRLMLVNVGVALVVVGFAAALTVVLVRRNMRQRVEAERLAAMGTATARILHQIKNPLQTILLHAEMLEDEALASDPAARQEICEAIVTEATRMTDLLADLSAYASGGQRRLHLSPMPLNELVADALRTGAREAPWTGIEIVSGPIEPLVVNGDPHFLRQAFENVLRNAREALQQSDGASPRVEVSLRRRGADAVIEVRDNGPGIEAARLNVIFEPFVTTKSRGMGLGLPICREIMERHGGRVEIRSRPGVGTTVSLVLPVVRSVREAQPA
ncbi:MAG TPA: HAMP domain-containing sensor histidine kinase [Longimicrobiales bacterium]